MMNAKLIVGRPATWAVLTAGAVEEATIVADHPADLAGRAMGLASMLEAVRCELHRVEPEYGLVTRDGLKVARIGDNLVDLRALKAMKKALGCVPERFFVRDHHRSEAPVIFGANPKTGAVGVVMSVRVSSPPVWESEAYFFTAKAKKGLPHLVFASQTQRETVSERLLSGRSVLFRQGDGWVVLHAPVMHRVTPTVPALLEGVGVRGTPCVAPNGVKRAVVEVYTLGQAQIIPAMMAARVRP